MKFTITNETNDIEKVQPEDKPFKVRLGDIEGRKMVTKSKYVKINPLKFFKLSMLRKSLKDNGYTPSKFGYVSLTYNSTTGKYLTFDGNHRLLILKELYGDDYEIEAIRHIPCDDCGDLNFNIPIVQIPVMVFFILYALLPTIILAICLYIIYYYLPDFKLYTKLHVHPVKRLTWLYNKSQDVYSFVMNIFYNTKYIINIVILLTYVIWVFWSNLYVCIIMIIIQVALTQTLKYFKLEELKCGDLIKKLKFW